MNACTYRKREQTPGPEDIDWYVYGLLPLMLSILFVVSEGEHHIQPDQPPFQPRTNTGLLSLLRDVHLAGSVNTVVSYVNGLT